MLLGRPACLPLPDEYPCRGNPPWLPSKRDKLKNAIPKGHDVRPTFYRMNTLVGVTPRGYPQKEIN